MENLTEKLQSKFEYRFVSLLAAHLNDGQEGDEAQELDQLGLDGWQIRSVTPDPQLPAARLLVALQRERV